jgi:hypothetical protein
MNYLPNIGLEMMNLKFCLSIALLLLQISFLGCQNEIKPQKCVKAEVHSFNWESSFRTAQSEPSFIISGSDNGSKREATINDSFVLSKIEEFVNKDIQPCENHCQIDIRLSMLLYAKNEIVPDTLSFGKINKAKFNESFITLDEELVKLILSRTDSTHLERFNRVHNENGSVN